MLFVFFRGNVNNLKYMNNNVIYRLARRQPATNSSTTSLTCATRSLSHRPTSDVFITRAEQTVNSVSVDPPVLSDHLGQLSLASLRGLLIEYQLRLG